jgi:hypothetical protein
VIRRLITVVLLVVAVAATYQLFIGPDRVTPKLVTPRPASVIGSGDDAVGVSASGVVLAWRPAPEEESLPRLPAIELSGGGRLAGPLLQQARILGAAPPALRPYLESSYYGETGVDVVLTSGIELRFGDASRAEEKWRAAVAVLANPSITALDYVNVHAPRHAAVGGESYALPPLE